MRIAIFSTSRADLGSLTPVFCELKNRPGHEVHLTKFQDFNAPEIAIILGDRFETLELAFKLNLNHTPIAHLSGGDVTEGSQDDCFRHAITKLSHLHFPTNADAHDRILQMGEEPWRVRMVGSPAIDSLKSAIFVDRKYALQAVGLEDGPFILISLHPHTLGNLDKEIAELGDYLERVPPDVAKVFIGPNADRGSGDIDTCFSIWSKHYKNSVYFKDTVRPLYLSLMKSCNEMVGNSSAMFYEAPTLGTKTVLIGDRQQGRQPIYGDGMAARRIADVICGITDFKLLLRKKFIDIEGYAGSFRRRA